MRARAGAAAAILVASAVCTRAAAADGKARPEVALSLQGCAELAEDEVRRVLAADLGALIVDAADADRTTTVTITCEPPRARLRVRDPLSKKESQRTLDLGRSDPRARARLVAVAASELVMASWSELELAPDPRVPAEGAPAPIEARQAARDVARARITPILLRERPQRSDEDEGRRAAPVRVLGLVTRRAFFRKPGALWGGGARIGHDRFTRLGWTLDALGETGHVTDGARELDIVTATVGGAILWHWDVEPVAFRLGGGVRMGFARTEDGRGGGLGTVAPWGWPLATASIGVLPVKPLAIELAAETGYVLLPVSEASSSTSDANLHGAWFGLSLGVGLSF